MTGMRQLLKKWQWFVAFNLAALAYVYLTRNLRFTVKDVASLVLVLGVMNVIALISARRHKDWKK